MYNPSALPGLSFTTAAADSRHFMSHLYSSGLRYSAAAYFESLINYREALLRVGKRKGCWLAMWKVPPAEEARGAANVRAWKEGGGGGMSSDTGGQGSRRARAWPAHAIARMGLLTTASISPYSTCAYPTRRSSGRGCDGSGVRQRGGVLAEVGSSHAAMQPGQGGTSWPPVQLPFPSRASHSRLAALAPSAPSHHSPPPARS